MRISSSQIRAFAQRIERIQSIHAYLYVELKGGVEFDMY